MSHYLYYFRNLEKQLTTTKYLIYHVSERAMSFIWKCSNKDVLNFEKLYIQLFQMLERAAQILNDFSHMQEEQT